MPGSWEGLSINSSKTDAVDECLSRPSRVHGQLLPADPVCPARALSGLDLVMAELDEIIPAWSVKKELARLPNAQLLRLNCTHFDPYTGSWFPITAERDFLTKHLVRNEAAKRA